MTISVADGITLPPGTTVTTIPGGSGAGGGGTTITDPVIPGTIQGTGLISGGSVRWNSGLNFTIAAARYQINQVVYNSPETNVTLDNPIVDKYRVDAFVVTSAQTAIKVTGPTVALSTADDLTVDPVLDPATQVKLNTILIAPNSFTVPCKNNVVFQEGAAWPAEWTATAPTGGFNVASTVTPYAGLKCVEATAAPQGSRLEFLSTLNIETQKWDMLFFHIKSKADWGTQSLVMQWRTDDFLTRSEIVVLKQSAFNFDSKSQNYRMIGIPMKAFGTDSIVVNTLVFTVMGAGPGIGFFIDDIILQSGLVVMQQSDRLRWAGPWSAAGVQYKLNDVVTFGGIQYRCSQSSDGPGSVKPIPEVAAGQAPRALWDDMSGDMVAAATVPWDLGASRIFTLLLTGHIPIMPAPIGAMEGRKYTLTVIQDAVGGRQIQSWDAYYKWPNDIPPTLSTAPNARDIIEFVFLSGTGTPSGHAGLHGRLASGAAATPAPTLQNTFVGYGSTNNLLTGTQDLYFRVDLGTLTLQKPLNNALSMSIINTSQSGAGDNAKASYYAMCNNTSKYFALSKMSEFRAAAGLFVPEMALLENTTGPFLAYNSTVKDFIFAAGGVNAANERFRIYATGGIGFRSLASPSLYNIKFMSNEFLSGDRNLTLFLNDSDKNIQLFGNFGIGVNVNINGIVGDTVTINTFPGNSTVKLPLTGTLLADPTTTIGDLVVRDVAYSPTAPTPPVRLAAGATAGHVLMSNGTGVMPSYQALPAPVAPTLTYQQVGYGDTLNKMKSSTELVYNDSTGQLLLTKAMSAPRGMVITNTDSSTTAATQIQLANGTSSLSLIKTGTGFATAGLKGPHRGILENTTQEMLYINTNNNDHVFSTAGSNSTSEKFRVYDLCGIGIRSVNGNYNMKIRATEVMTRDTTLTITMASVDRQISMAGNITIGGDVNTQGTLQTIGNYQLVMRTTGSTDVTLPTSGLLTAGGMKFLGLWSAGTQYVVNDVVLYGGGVYLAPGSVTIGVPPPTGWTTITDRPSYANLPDTATINWNLAALPSAWIALAAARTMAVPTNMVAGATYLLLVVTGGWSITWASAFKWPNGRVPLASTGTDAYSFFCDGNQMFGVQQPAFS